MTIKDYEYRKKKFTTQFYVGNRAGIRLEVNHTHNTLDISGWYDGQVGIEGATVPLKEFLKEMGITAKDLEESTDKP
jgi:hypothetical protein